MSKYDREINRLIQKQEDTMYNLGVKHGELKALNALMKDANEHNYTTVSDFMGAMVSMSEKLTGGNNE